MVAVCVPMAVKVSVSKGVPLGGETLLVGLINVDSVTEEIPPTRTLAVRPLVKLTFPSGAVRPVSVTQRMRVPAAVEFTSIVLEASWPMGKGGVPVAAAWMENELVAPQQRTGSTVTGLGTAAAKVVKVGGKVGDSPALIVIKTALAPDAQSSGAAVNAAAARNFFMLGTARER